MKIIAGILLFITAMFTTLGLASILKAQENPSVSDIQKAPPELSSNQVICDLSAIKDQIAQQSQEFSQEMRQIKREIALLRHTMEKPGLKEVFAGIGYIFGLCGVAFYFSARKKRNSRNSREDRSNAHS
ncbi:MAG: hypothetical protein WHS38_01510 [Thermodesulforhabdaceae bacterium]